MMTFSQRVVELALSIPPGRVVTYGDIARAAGGGAQAARSVTSILGKYPNHRAIPWHRIVYADGKVWFNPAHETKRRTLYRKEHITLTSAGFIKNFAEIRFDFAELT